MSDNYQCASPVRGCNYDSFGVCTCGYGADEREVPHCPWVMIPPKENSVKEPNILNESGLLYSFDEVPGWMRMCYRRFHVLSKTRTFDSVYVPDVTSFYKLLIHWNLKSNQWQYSTSPFQEVEMSLIKGVDDEVPDMEEGDEVSVTVGMLKMWMEKLDPALPVCVSVNGSFDLLRARGVSITATEFTVYNNDYDTEY